MNWLNWAVLITCADETSLEDLQQIIQKTQTISISERLTEITFQGYILLSRKGKDYHQCCIDGLLNLIQTPLHVEDKRMCLAAIYEICGDSPEGIFCNVRNMLLHAIEYVYNNAEVSEDYLCTSLQILALCFTNCNESTCLKILYWPISTLSSISCEELAEELRSTDKTHLVNQGPNPSYSCISAFVSQSMTSALTSVQTLAYRIIGLVAVCSFGTLGENFTSILMKRATFSSNEFDDPVRTVVVAILWNICCVCGKNRIAENIVEKDRVLLSSLHWKVEMERSIAVIGASQVVALTVISPSVLFMMVYELIGSFFLRSSVMGSVRKILVANYQKRQPCDKFLLSKAARVAVLSSHDKYDYKVISEALGKWHERDAGQARRLLMEGVNDAGGVMDNIVLRVLSIEMETYSLYSFPADCLTDDVKSCLLILFFGMMKPVCGADNMKCLLENQTYEVKQSVLQNAIELF